MNVSYGSAFLPSLAEVTNTDPLIVDQETPVSMVLAQLNQHGATCALIRANGQLTHVFTMRDIVHLAVSGAASDNVLQGHPIITISHSHPEGIVAALRLLVQHQIHHLVAISDEGQIAGVISHESICAAITPAMLMHLRTAAEVMATDPITARADQPLIGVARIMDEYKVSCVVIVTPGAGDRPLPLGLITERDIARAHAAQMNLATTLAHQILAPQLISIAPDATLWDVHQAMDRAHVRRIIVVGPAGELVGLITQSALLYPTDPLEVQRTVDLLQRSLNTPTSQPLAQIRPPSGDTSSRGNICLLLVDDNEVFLKVIKRLLISRGFTIAGMASSGRAAIEQARTLHPDIILMDVEMPEMGGLEATSAIMDERPDARIVMLTMAEDDATLFEAVRHGAAGYLLKNVDIDRLSEYILGLMRGEAALSPVLAQRVLGALASQMRQDDTHQPDPSSMLTHHQIRILTLLAQGNTYKEIGRLLGYSERAIKYHTGEAIRQLQLKDRAEAVAYTRAHMRRRSWPQVSDA
jgi:DNA-binding NarL/FixJ family response regulator/CBS domain-containing protein